MLMDVSMCAYLHSRCAVMFNHESRLWWRLWICPNPWVRCGISLSNRWGGITNLLYHKWHSKGLVCIVTKSGLYTLSHLENDRDVTQRVEGYTLQNASFVRQSRDSFLNAWENKEVTRAITSVLFCTTRWRHGRSRGETKYSAHHFLHSLCKCFKLEETTFCT